MSTPTLTAHTAVHFRWRVADRVGFIELNRPERKNPLTFASYAELRDLFRALAYERGVRAVVLSGAVDDVTRDVQWVMQLLGVTSGREHKAEPGASPNGGPAERLGDARAGGGPPSVRSSHIRRTSSTSPTSDLTREVTRRTPPRSVRAPRAASRASRSRRSAGRLQDRQAPRFARRRLSAPL